MQIRCVRLTGVEFHNHALVWKVDNDVLDAIYLHQHRTKSPDAFITILAFSRDLDRFQNGMVGALRIKRIARLGFAGSRWVHELLNVPRALGGRNFARNRLQDLPDVPRQDLLASPVRMNSVARV